MRVTLYISSKMLITLFLRDQCRVWELSIVDIKMAQFLLVMLQFICTSSFTLTTHACQEFSAGEKRYLTGNKKHSSVMLSVPLVLKYTEIGCY